MGAAFCASPSFPIPLSKAQPWLRRLRQERMHELTDHISQIIFNDVELTADIFSTLKTNMRVRVKGGAAFSLHAQRLASLGFVNDLMEPLDVMHMMHVHDLDVSVAGQGAQRRCCVSCGARLVPALAESEPWRHTGGA